MAGLISILTASRQFRREASGGEHPDWAEYRAAMLRQGKSLLRVTPRRWGPVAAGGFPPELA